MVPKFRRSPFTLEEAEDEEHSKTIRSIDAITSSGKGSVIVGLRIVTHNINSHGKPNVNVVVKSSLRTPVKSMNYCYLKSCHLCNKELSLDKPVFMYRGDQGFCSIECRERQIILDEMREIEIISTKQMISRYRHCSSAAGRRETRSILEDLRRQRRRPPLPRQNHWAILS